MGIEKSVKPTFPSEKVGSFEPTTTIKTFLRPVIDLKVGSGHEVVKTVQWTVFSESPSNFFDFTNINWRVYEEFI